MILIVSTFTLHQNIGARIEFSNEIDVSIKKLQPKFKKRGGDVRRKALRKKYFSSDVIACKTPS